MKSYGNVTYGKMLNTSTLNRITCDVFPINFVCIFRLKLLCL